MKDPTFWILARAGGITAYLLMTGAMVAGLVVKSRPFGRAVRAAAVVDAHRFLTLLALGTIAVHGLSLTLDKTVRISPAALFVPGLSPYRPLPTALGVLAAELALVLFVSFPLRKIIGVRVWRSLHWVTYGVFAAATVHGLAAGTDTARPWAFSMYVGAFSAVAFATAWRVLTRPQGGNRVPNRDRPVAV